MHSEQITVAIQEPCIDVLGQTQKTAKERFQRTSVFLTKFLEDPTRFTYEEFEGRADPRLYYVAITEDYGAIALRSEKCTVYLVLFLGEKDEAKAWCCCHKCVMDCHGDIFSVMCDTSVLEHIRQRASEPQGPFAALTQEMLQQLAVPKDLYSAVFGVRTSDDLECLRGFLLPKTYEALAGLLLGEDFATVASWGPAPADGTGSEPVPGSEQELEAGLKNSFYAKQHFQVNPSEHELQEMIAAPLEKWRIFLHPSQRSIVERKWNGPVRVLGGAGTGKTVVALHRACWLAERCPKDKKVLVTTYTRTLAQDLARQLTSLCPPEYVNRLEVCNLDLWVMRFLRQNSFEYKVVYDKDAYAKLWAMAMDRLPDDSRCKNLEFLREEWTQVVQFLEIQTEKDYCTTPRKGRKLRLSRKDRKELWAVFEEFRALLDKNGLCQPADAMREARLLLETHGKYAQSYYAIVVDETQDMSPQALKLLRKLVPAGENDLFLVGDAHQRIYGSPVPLTSCGIEVRGRAKKLHINYRTTEQIRKKGISFLSGMTYDNLDTETDDVNEYISLMQGEEPTTATFVTRKEAITEIVKRLAESREEQSLDLRNICIASPFLNDVPEIEHALTAKGIPSLVLTAEMGDEREREGVRIATMHRIKGLEFDRVFLLDRQHPNYDDDLRKQQEMSLRYVAATRARTNLFFALYSQY